MKRKRLFQISALLAFPMLVLWLSAAPGTFRNSVTLAWSYPSDDLTNVDAFIIYSSTNLTLPMSNWPRLITVSGTNLQITVGIDRQQRWFTATASNWWGESDFSNVVGVPVPPRNDVNLRLGP